MSVLRKTPDKLEVNDSQNSTVRLVTRLSGFFSDARPEKKTPTHTVDFVSLEEHLLSESGSQHK